MKKNLLKFLFISCFFIFSLIMLVALFNMFASLSMMFMEKRRNLNTLLTIGTKKIDIAKIFFINGVYTTFFGLALGLILGSILVLFWLQHLNCGSIKSGPPRMQPLVAIDGHRWSRTQRVENPCSLDLKDDFNLYVVSQSFADYFGTSQHHSRNINVTKILTYCGQ